MKIAVAVAMGILLQSHPATQTTPPAANAAGIESCNHGPVPWSFAELDYFVFACTDGTLIVQPAANDHPWFMVYPFEYGGYRVMGSGDMLPSEYEAMVAWYNMPSSEVRAIHASAMTDSDGIAR